MTVRHNLPVGETQGDRVGCYLLWIPGEEGEPASYHSLAKSKAELIEDCRALFSEMRRLKIEQITKGPRELPGMPLAVFESMATEFRRRWEAELTVITHICLHTDEAIDSYLSAGASSGPFYSAAGIEVYLGTGERMRQKVKGEHLE